MLSYVPASKHAVFVNVDGFNILLSALHFAQELEQTREEVEVMYTGTDRLRSEYQRLCAGTRDLLATLRYQKPSTKSTKYKVPEAVCRHQGPPCNTQASTKYKVPSTDCQRPYAGIRDLPASCSSHAPILFLENVLIL